MDISVIVTTAPDREESLYFCLKMLVAQTVQNFEVIVTDDGSAKADQVVRQYQDQLDIRHLWRPNDRCVSRSRNLAVASARGDFLVFIDGDVLLEPRVIEGYQRYAKQEPDTVITGYFGGSDILHHAPSLWLPERSVNYMDTRIHCVKQQSLEVKSAVSRHPFIFFWAGNMGVSKEIYCAVGGFDERYRGWGYEDTQFAYDFSHRGFPLLYALDLWSEHQIHPRSSSFYVKKDRNKLFDIRMFQKETFPEIQIAGDPLIIQALTDALFQHYYPQDPMVPESNYLKACKREHVIYTDAIEYAHMLEGTLK